METNNPFDSIRSMMEDNLAKVGSATKSYLDLLQKSMLSMPSANEDQVKSFRAYIDPQLAANQAFVTRLLHAKGIPEAVQIQVEYFQSQMRTSVNDATQLAEKATAPSKPSAA